MNILIKGMALPKNGVYTFYFASDENGENTTVLIRNDLTGTIVANESVIEIPTPHGRLIDADALFQDLREHNIPFNNDINSAINVAPTILEAER